MQLRIRRAEIVLLLAVAACASPQRGRAPVAAVGQPVPPSGQATGPRAPKIGNPYQVYGVWYYPKDDAAYDERGVASWYGPGFHALTTANGETYDQAGISAAHKTLPMPSYVEVENLDNGRKLTVRVNDRGPFVDGRIIDLSQKSAQLLGVDRPGTARVRVRRVFPDAATLASLEPQRTPVVIAAAQQPAAQPVARQPAAIADASTVAIAAAPTVRTVDLPPANIGAGPTAAPSPLPVAANGWNFVQVAALSDAGRVAWLSSFLSDYGPVVTEKLGSGLTRVRLGPYPGVDSANAVLARLRAAGYTDARLVNARITP